MFKQSFVKNLFPFLLLLGLYIVLILFFSSNDLIGDEFRHVRYADNLLNGFYTETANPELVNGPGYPLVLLPFLALGSGVLMLKLLNAFFVFIGVLYFKKTLSFFIKEKYAIVLAVLLGLYPPLLRFMPMLYSEPLAFMLVCGFIYHLIKLYRSTSLDRKQLAITAIYLGFLVLVKIIFMQVMTLSLLLIGAFFLWKKNKEVLKMAIVIAGAFLLIAPYLVYAYSLTGKAFYLGTGGGEILYHRATPFENEFGNWFSRENILKGGDKDYQPDSVYKNLKQLSENHKEVYLNLEGLSHMQRDSAFKAIAISNMKEHPVKYLKNTVANIGRFAFHYPFSYREHSLAAYGYMIPNMFILVLWILSIYPFLRVRKKVPIALKAIMLFFLIYASAIILLDGRGRNFIVLAPSLVLFFTVVFSKTDTAFTLKKAAL